MSEKQKKDLLFFFVIVATVNLAIGFSDGLFSNYFKEVYSTNGFQRGLIEFPRELPGVIVFFLISAISFFGDITIAMIAQAAAALGLVVLGFFTPSFGVMLGFLFLYSMGLHLYMPLNDSIGMSLAEPDQLGKRMGQVAGIRFAFLTVAGLAVFFLFRFGVFSFQSKTKWTFVVAAVLYIVALLLFIKLKRDMGQVRSKREKPKFIFRKEYKFYYMLAVVFGVQKQVMIVFGPWVLIETLGQRVDTIVLLGIIASTLGMFLMPQLGKWIDRFGVKKLLYVDALSFIFVYLCYGMLAQSFNTGALAKVGFPVLLTGALFVVDRLSSQMGIIRTVYLKSIALSSSEVTPTLSLAMTMDHIVSILVGVTGGVAWITFGSQYIFYTVAALSLINLAVAILVKEPRKIQARLQ
ncbi:MAG: MFS transporter [Eubacteriales bacterium]|nr:MFS transporter [Eubacteriales bacterium]